MYFTKRILVSFQNSNISFETGFQIYSLVKMRMCILLQLISTNSFYDTIDKIQRETKENF